MRVTRASAGALVLALSLLLSACGERSGAQPSRDATIYRDAYGVPHVYGASDADAAFAFAYAQAEDNFAQIDENFMRATGRSAEIFGEAGFLDDWLNQSLEVVRLSKAEFEASPPHVRALLEGYTDGLNAYASANGYGAIAAFEPWHPLAFIRYIYYQRGFAGAAGVTRERAARAYQHLNGGELKTGALELKAIGEGSNAWAVAAKRSVSGAPLLFINPHLPFFGPSQVLEGHVMSGEGWNFSGYSRFGFPLPYVGFNERLGWASTDNAADLSDLYVERFDDPADPLSYAYDGDRRRAETWSGAIRVKGGEGLEARTVKFLKTHHGPVVAAEAGALMALKMAKFEGAGWLAEWLDMTKARDLSEFRAATGRLDMLFGNYLYADQAGNILYVYNAAVPVREAAFDWSAPLDGSLAATEWKGYHPVESLPQLLNPASGHLQNSNGSPFLATNEGNPDPADFPPYMVPEADNYRSAQSRRILLSQENFSFADFERLAYDTHVLHAEDDIPRLVAAMGEMAAGDPARAARLSGPMALLSEWDGRSTKTSEAMTLYIYWAEARGEDLGLHPAPWSGSAEEKARYVEAFEAAVARLERETGSWRTPWGEINRHQRRRPFDAAADSLAIDGGPTWAGTIFSFWGMRESEGAALRAGVGGHSYFAVVEFAETVKAKSLHAFGASGDPASAHHADQAALYADHKLKDAWLSLEDVKANAVETYRPGER